MTLEQTATCTDPGPWERSEPHFISNLSPYSPGAIKKVVFDESTRKNWKNMKVWMLYADATIWHIIHAAVFSLWGWIMFSRSRFRATPLKQSSFCSLYEELKSTQRYGFSNYVANRHPIPMTPWLPPVWTPNLNWEFDFRCTYNLSPLFSSGEHIKTAVRNHHMEIASEVWQRFLCDDAPSVIEKRGVESSLPIAKVSRSLSACLLSPSP